jgi:hypothetical protein
VIYDFTVKWDAADQGKLQFVSAVLTLWLSMVGPSDSEEEICIDNEIGNIPPH